MTERLLIYAPDAGFVLPFIRAALKPATVEPTDLDEGHKADMAFMISNTAIYGDNGREAADEHFPIDNNSEYSINENRFNEFCRSTGTTGIILRCPDIIGTGMTGFPAQLAASVWKGTFFHFPGNDARRSAIHASDVAQAVKILASADSRQGIYNLSDGSDPTVHDLAEALAFRMKNKRISTLSTGPQQWLGKLFYGRKRYAQYTTSRTVSADAIAAFADWRPTPVCEYLRNHIYDETSL